MKNTKSRLWFSGMIVFFVALVLGYAVMAFVPALIHNTLAGDAEGKRNASRNEQEEKRGRDGAEEEERVFRLPFGPGKQSTPIGIQADAFGVTPPIRDLREFREGPPKFKGEPKVQRELNNELEVDRVLPGWNTPTTDPLAEQSRETNLANAPMAMPGPTLTFDGIESNANLVTFGTTSMPPDTVGDVGPNHYVHSTNFGTFRVFDKAGTALGATMRISSLFSSLPASNKCRLIDNGDPVVIYDPLADRWLITQFALVGPSNEIGAPNYQCIAISQTGDPTGSYFAYGFKTPNDFFHDYPHFGVWTNGYYVAAHEFNSLGTAFVEGGFFAFNRDKMLVGDPTANCVYIGNTAVFGHLPADIDGNVPPAAGTPAMFFANIADEFGAPADAITSFEFVPDYMIPANSTLTAKPSVATAVFDPRDPSGRADIEQPAPAVASQNLDAISQRLLQRVGYRNLGTASVPINSYVMNWTVNVSGVNPTTPGTHQAGVRWTEMRRSGAGVMSIFDQGTHAPDPVSGTGRNRWMGSIAQDYLGNLALGFSRSGTGAADFPDIVWAGRTGGIVAAGTMNEGEATMFASTGVQQTTNSRWGDYSAMSIDPSDDCTFWYTTEYRLAVNNGTGTNNPFKWNTRVGTVKFPACKAAPKGQLAVTVTECSSGNPINGATVTANPGGFNRQTKSDGTLVSNITAAPDTYTVAASFSGVSNSTSAIVTNGGTTPVSLCLSGPFMAPTASAITAESCSTANGAVDPAETVTVNLSLQNIVGLATTNLTGTLQTTGGVILAGPAQNFGALTSGGGAVTRSFTFTADPNLLCGSTVTLTLALTDGMSNLGTVTYTLPASATTGSAITIPYTGPAVPIPDATATAANATISVSGQTTSIADLNFRFNGTSAVAPNSGLDHTWVGDLGITLKSPAGTTVQMVGLINSAAGANGGCANDNFFNTILDDEAAGGFINVQCAVGNGMTGTFKSDNLFSVFDGENPNGTWTLTAKDIATGDIGTIRAFALVITPFTCCQTKVWTGAISTDWNNAGNWSPSGVPVSTDNVLIPPTGVTNEPTIGTGVTVASLSEAANRTLTVGPSGTFSATNAALSLVKGTVVYAGTVSQLPANVTYNNLTINNAAGVSLGGSLTLDGVLTLTNGVVTTGANTMTVSCTGSSTGASSTSYVIGNVVKQYCATGSFSFPVGTANGFSKLDTNITALGTNPSSLLVRTDTGTAPAAPPLSSATTLQRYWTLTETGNITANLVFNYLDPTDIMGTEATYQLIRIEGGVAIRIPPPTATVNTVANTASINGVQNFSLWTLGQPAAPTSAPANVGGRVTTVKGAPLSNVTMTLLDTVLVESRTTVTDANGNYQFVAITTGRNILVTPSQIGYAFSPTNRLFNHIGELTNVDFVGTPDTAQTRAAVNDFDGDGTTDLSVLRPSEMTWYINQSSSGQMRAHVWGLTTDRLVPADYDGDLKTDIATYRPSTGTWYIFQSATDTLRAVQWGLDTDVASPADFDGDGKADPTVYRASEGRWYVLQSTTNSHTSYQWGLAGDVPVAADYNGDRRADFAVYRPSSGYWYIVNSSDATTRFESWGLSTDRVAVGDYDGDAKSDFAVYRPSTGTWHIRLNGDDGIVTKRLGEAQDRPVQGDFDGDGKTDVAVFRPSTAKWYILQSSDGLLIDRQWGQTGDIPAVPAYEVADDAGPKVNPLSFVGCYEFLGSPCAMQSGPFGISTGLVTTLIYTPPRGR